MKEYLKIFSLFHSPQKSEVIILLFSSVGMAVLQTVGIASILPFISVINAPEIIHTNKYLAYLYDFFNFNNQKGFLMVLGISTLLILITSNIFSAFATRVQLRFTFLQGHYLSQKLFKQYLSQPYIFFLNHNTADLTKNIIAEIDRCIRGVLSPILNVISRLIITFCIIGLLLLIDPFLAILVFLICGGSYAFIYKINRRSLNICGKKSATTQSYRNKIVNEAFGGIKDLKLLGKESEFLKMYSSPSYEFAMSQTKSQTIAELPKYALETMIFGGILLIMLYFIGIKQDLEGVLPVLALYAFAGYRLMPALQRIFAGLTALRFHLPVLDMINKDIIHSYQGGSNLLSHESKSPPLKFYDTVTLQNVTYSYPKSGAVVLQNLDLSIQANTTIGFVGETGSGKTTLIDIILGLLPLKNGKLLVDGTHIKSNNVRSWQKNIGYVPQQIYLADDSVTNNIAFGVPGNDIDHHAVTKAAQIAKVHDFVLNSLSNGYETKIGERGIRLSGGQRQRIGIARAVYHDPQILILDEATSALDGATENAIMDAIHNLSKEKTILMIAHRITTVKECDIIHVMDKGEIIESGTYEDLIDSSVQFREMAKVSSPDIN
jgi:ABC-type multidrug transport system fused ATPase/permease subunit